MPVVVDAVYTEPTVIFGAGGSSGFASAAQDGILAPAPVARVGHEKGGLRYTTNYRASAVDGGVPLPPGAVIDSAKVQIKASVVDEFALALDVELSSPLRDGLWNAHDGAVGVRGLTYRSQVNGFQVDSVSSGTKIAGTGGGFGLAQIGLQDPNGILLPFGVQQIYHTFLATSDYNIGAIGMSWRRSNTNVLGGMRAHLYQAAADDGTDNRPTGPPLAVSNSLNVNTLDTSPAYASWTFVGSNRFRVLTGRRYVVIWDWTARATALGGPLIPGTDYIAAVFGLPVTNIPGAELGENAHADFVNGSGLGVGVGFGWNRALYPNALAWPSTRTGLGADAVGADRYVAGEEFGSPRPGPLGARLIRSVPTFTVIGEWYDVVDVAELVQEQVDDPGYDPVNPILGFTMSTTDSAAEEAEREGDDIRVVVSWHFDEQVVGDLSFDVESDQAVDVALAHALAVDVEVEAAGAVELAAASAQAVDVELSHAGAIETELESEIAVEFDPVSVASVDIE